jgi:release factor glutamine methyltransferase
MLEHRTRTATKRLSLLDWGPRVYTIGEMLNRAAEYLQQKGLENARLNAETLLGTVLNLSRVDLYLRFDRPLTDEELPAFRSLIKRRLGGQPLQYLTGQTEFYSLTFLVNPSVLIPRPETEILVDALVERLGHERGDLLVADVGTGCGNIAIALAVHLPRARLWATDRSREALALAQTNAGKHGVEDRIHFLQGDLLAPLREWRGRLTTVVSNPPYVTTAELKRLPAEIRDHEPLMALDGGRDGLEIIRRLVEEATDLLAPEGWLALEVGSGQAETVKELIARMGSYGETETLPDYAGIPRVILARRISRHREG